jgi:hypothetical protein
MAYDDYAAQVERQKRRRQLAQAMMQGGGDRIDQVGGVAVPYSMGEGLAQMGRAIAGKFAMDRADKEEKDIRAKRAEDVAAALSNYDRAVPDDEVGRESLSRIMASEDELPEPVSGQSESLRKLALELMPSEDVAELEYKQRLAGANGPRGVQSTVIGEDGFYYTVDRLSGKMSNTGVRAAPNTRVIEQEGNTPFSVVTGRGQAGRIIPLGGAPSATPMRTPTAGERQRDIEQNKAAVELATQPKITAATTEAKERTEHDLKKEFDAPAARARLDSTNQKLDLFIRKAGDIATDPNLSRATGMMAYIPSVYGGGAKDTENAIEALKAQLGFNELQEMRANSPTGGALGSVTERELTYLQNSLVSLERSQSPEQYRANLRDLIEYSKGIKARLNRAYEQTYRKGGKPSAGGAVELSDEELLQRYGS